MPGVEGLQFTPDVQRIRTPEGMKNVSAVMFSFEDRLMGRILGPGNCGGYLIQVVLDGEFKTSPSMFGSLQEAMRAVELSLQIASGLQDWNKFLERLLTSLR